LALMQGEFRYRSLVLLANTHLRFFTIESLEQLFKDADLLLTELRRTKRGVFDAEIEVDSGSVTDETLRKVQEDPEALTYQFVLTAYPFGEAGTLATYEKILFELSRKLRDFEELQRLLNTRTKQLAEREREVTRLSQEVYDLRSELARIVQSGKGEV